MRVYTIWRYGTQCSMANVGDVLEDLRSDVERTSAGGAIEFPVVKVSEMTQAEYDALPEFNV